MRWLIMAAGLMAGALLTTNLVHAAPATPICADCVKATMEALAGDAFKGRRCGTADENAAARYLAGNLKKLGVQGGLPDGAYLQEVRLLTPVASATPVLEIISGDRRVALAQGMEMAQTGAPARLDGQLVRVTDAGGALDGLAGKLVIYDTPKPDATGPAKLFKAGAAAVILSAKDLPPQRWAGILARPPGATQVVGGVERPAPPPQTVIYLKPEAFDALPRGEARASLLAPRGEPLARTTYNVIGVRHGKAPGGDGQSIFLTSHYDHLGVRDGVIFHGANDDASGTAAVMEFARVLGTGPAHRRTVYFAMFGCEEEGGLAAQYFLAHPPTPIANIAANLEFEMIGADDPKQPGFMMLTGWERSNLGPTLAAHGAKIGPDPYPEQHFFARSDNYQLALQGVVAQTISAWPVPPTYHSATDDLAHIDLGLMNRLIGSLIEPVRWLADSDFVPTWNPGQKP
jgi:aminopeptidase YwaD